MVIKIKYKFMHLIAKKISSVFSIFLILEAIKNTWDQKKIYMFSLYFLIIKLYMFITLINHYINDI